MNHIQPSFGSDTSSVSPGALTRLGRHVAEVRVDRGLPELLIDDAHTFAPGHEPGAAARIDHGLGSDGLANARFVGEVDRDAPAEQR
jgi:hypothetical protein